MLPIRHFGKLIYFGFGDAQLLFRRIPLPPIPRRGIPGLEAWSTCWLSPRNTLQLGYQRGTLPSDFIPGGEAVNDGSIKMDWWMRHDLGLLELAQRYSSPAR
jgi:hypothetical protein